MKAILFLIGLGLAGYAGYHFEPALEPTIFGKSRSAITHKSTSAPEATAPQIDYSTITQDQLPEEVTLLTDVGFSDDATGLRMTLKAGAKAKVVRLVQSTLVIRIGTTEYITSVDVSQTDLAKRLTTPTEDPVTPPSTEEKTPAPEPNPTPQPAPQPEPQPAPEPQPTPTPDPFNAPTPKPTPAKDPFPAIQTTPTPSPEPKTTPEAPATPEPTPAGDPAPPPAPKPASQAAILSIMRDSLSNKQIKAFQLSEVKSWTAEPQETIEDITYDVGAVLYEQDTVFGLKSMTAKAYIRNGKVERWVWPKSGITIE